MKHSLTNGTSAQFSQKSQAKEILPAMRGEKTEMVHNRMSSRHSGTGGRFRRLEAARAKNAVDGPVFENPWSGLKNCTYKTNIVLFIQSFIRTRI